MLCRNLPPGPEVQSTKYTTGAVFAVSRLRGCTAPVSLGPSPWWVGTLTPTPTPTPTRWWVGTPTPTPTRWLVGTPSPTPTPVGWVPLPLVGGYPYPYPYPTGGGDTIWAGWAGWTSGSLSWIPVPAVEGRGAGEGPTTSTRARFP